MLRLAEDWTDLVEFCQASCDGVVCNFFRSVDLDCEIVSASFERFEPDYVRKVMDHLDLTGAQIDWIDPRFEVNR
ncbi:hypothetical protein APED_02145 [Acanthopleuribacter pedis]